MQQPFFIRHEKMLKKADPMQILGLYTEGNYTKIIMSDMSFFMVRSTLDNTLKKLPDDVFFKVSRNYAISVYYIDAIYKDYLTIGENSIPITRQYYKPLLQKLNVIE